MSIGRMCSGKYLLCTLNTAGTTGGHWGMTIAEDNPCQSFDSYIEIPAVVLWEYVWLSALSLPLSSLVDLKVYRSVGLQTAFFNVQCWFWRPFARVRWLTVPGQSVFGIHIVGGFLLYFANQASIVGVFCRKSSGPAKTIPFRDLQQRFQNPPCIKSSLAWVNQQ
jgi:hypothetical protein